MYNDSMRRMAGFAQIPIMIGMLIMAIALPIVSNMVKKSQDMRNRAEGEPLDYWHCVENNCVMAGKFPFKEACESMPGMGTCFEEDTCGGTCGGGGVEPTNTPGQGQKWQCMPGSDIPGGQCMVRVKVDPNMCDTPGNGPCYDSPGCCPEGSGTTMWYCDFGGNLIPPPPNDPLLPCSVGEFKDKGACEQMFGSGNCFFDSPDRCGVKCGQGKPPTPTNTSTPEPTATPTEGWVDPRVTPGLKKFWVCIKASHGCAKEEYSSAVECFEAHPELIYKTTNCLEAGDPMIPPGDISEQICNNSLSGCTKDPYVACNTNKESSDYGKCQPAGEFWIREDCSRDYGACWINDGLLGPERKECEEKCNELITPTATPTPTNTPTPTPMSFYACEVVNGENENEGKCVVKEYTGVDNDEGLDNCRNDTVNWPIACANTEQGYLAKNQCEGICFSRVPKVEVDPSACNKFVPVEVKIKQIDRITESHPYNVTVGDVNNDGKKDICIGYANESAYANDWYTGGNIKRCLKSKDDIYYWGTPETITPPVNATSPNSRFNNTILGILKNGTMVQFPYIPPSGRYPPESKMKVGGNSPYNTNTLYRMNSFEDFTAQMITADLNNDGIDDIVLSVRMSSKISIFYGKNDGTFLRTDVYSGNGYNAMSLADFKGDGKKDDLIVTATGDNNVIVLINDGSGSFTLVPYATVITSQEFYNYSPAFVTAADFNNDKFDDMAIIVSDGIIFYQNKGTGDGSLEYKYKVNSTGLWEIVALNLDNDMKLDLVTALTNSNKIIFWFNKNGVFGIGDTMVSDAGAAPGSLIAEDINGDKQKDLLYVTRKSNQLMIPVNR